MYRQALLTGALIFEHLFCSFPLTMYPKRVKGKIPLQTPPATESLVSLVIRSRKLFCISIFMAQYNTGVYYEKLSLEMSITT